MGRLLELDGTQRMCHHAVMAHTLLYITAPDKPQALHLADLLLEARLVACVNILPGIHSLYHWEGRREEAQECAMIAKTTEALAAAAIECVRKAHPYECPCIITLPITGGNEAFLAWIGQETHG